MISAFDKAIIRVQHINTFVNEIETVHKIVGAILDRNKDLMKKAGLEQTSRTNKHISSNKKGQLQENVIGIGIVCVIMIAKKLRKIAT